MRDIFVAVGAVVSVCFLVVVTFYVLFCLAIVTFGCDSTDDPDKWCRVVSEGALW